MLHCTYNQNASITFGGRPLVAGEYVTKCLKNGVLRRQSVASSGIELHRTNLSKETSELTHMSKWPIILLGVHEAAST